MATVRPADSSPIYAQWQQFINPTVASFPNTNDGTSDFIVPPTRQGDSYELSVGNDEPTYLRNMVIRWPTTVMPSQGAHGKPPRIYCEKLYVIDASLLTLVDIFARQIILLRAEQFRQAVEGLAIESELRELDYPSTNEMIHLPAGTHLNHDLNSDLGGGLTPLMQAAKTGNEAIVKLLLVAQADLEAMDQRGWRAITFANKEGHSVLVDLLLREGAQAKTRDFEGNSLLETAAELNDMAAVDLLLNAKADPLEVNSRGQTPLSLAVSHGALEVFEYLQGQDIEMSGTTSSNPQEMSVALMDASMKGDIAALQGSTNLDAATKRGDTPLIIAAKYGHAQTVQFLIKAKANIDACSTVEGTPLMCAVKNGSEPIAQLLLNAGARIKPRAPYQTLDLATQHPNILRMIVSAKPVRANRWLAEAIDEDQSELAQALYQAGARLSTPPNGLTLAVYAVRKNQPMVDFLVSIGTDLPNALRHLIQKKLTAAATLLLDKGVDVDSPDEYGRTLLIHSIIKAPTTFSQLLLARKANKNAVDFQQRTPLIYALMYEENDVLANELLDGGANPNTKDALGMTPFMHAVAYKGLNIARRLVHYLPQPPSPEASIYGIDAPDAKGRTALMYAAVTGNIEMVEFLLERGANLNAVTPKNKTALFFAIQHSHPELVEYLLEKKANTQLCPVKHHTLTQYAAQVHRAEQAATANMETTQRMLALNPSARVFRDILEATKTNTVCLPPPPPRAKPPRQTAISWKPELTTSYPPAEYKDAPVDG